MSIRLADISPGDTVIYRNKKEQRRQVIQVSYETGMLTLQGRNKRLHYSEVTALLEEKKSGR